jgi:hypothetical protein
VGDVDGQDQAPVGGLGLRHPGQHLPQPGHIHVSAVERVVHRAVPASVLGRQGEVHRRGHRPVGAQQGVSQIEQRVPARGQAVEEVVPEV